MQQLFELFTALLALIIGLVFFKKLNRFYHLLLLQVILYILFDIIAMAVDYMKYNDGNNNFVYNVLMPIETSLLFLAAQSYFNSSISKYLLLSLLSLFVLIFFMDIYFRTGIEYLANYAAGAQGILTSVVYIGVLYSYFMEKKKKYIDKGIIAASIGIIIYFACTGPYLVIMSYLYRVNPELDDVIFQWIITPAGSIRYLLIAFAFYLAAKSNKQSPALSN